MKWTQKCGISKFPIKNRDKQSEKLINFSGYITFAIGAYFKKMNNRYILKLSLNMKRREWSEGIWNQPNLVITPFIFPNA